ncbi:hypothetical protein [Nocardia exalbida]|uniref:hypothetical protein n=1 Tax=Nocardia exalbida TaxID=290231 RepID=UPI0002F22E40|nr:hypothetical protein [Nocardia exalbida]
MHVDPTSAELTESVARAARGLGLRVATDEKGGLWITARGEVELAPPVAIEFSEEAISDYYARIASRVPDDEPDHTPSSWWYMLMSTHLYEALYEMDRLGVPCDIVIGPSGLTAVPSERMT